MAAAEDMVVFAAGPVKMDLSSRESIRNFIAEAKRYGEISMVVNAVGFPQPGSHRGYFESGPVRHGRIAGGSGQGNQRGRCGCHDLQPVRVAYACILHPALS